VESGEEEEDLRGNGSAGWKLRGCPSLRARRWFSSWEVAVYACGFYACFEFAFIACCFIGIWNGKVLMGMHGFLNIGFGNGKKSWRS
jgi:hypothetical protein